MTGWVMQNHWQKMRHKNGNYIPFSMTRVPDEAWDTIFKKKQDSIFDSAKSSEAGLYQNVGADGKQKVLKDRRKEEATEDDLPPENGPRVYMPNISQERHDEIFGKKNDSKVVGNKKA